MKSNYRFIFLFAALLCAASGCTTKNKAKIQSQQAFIAGQQQVMSQLQRPINQIEIIGEVRNRTMMWSEGLTVSQAIVAAEYRGFRDPREISIERRGQMISINPKALLQGEDELLEPGDRIILR